MKNRGGRPKKEIDQRQFEAMCGIQATEEEICLVLGVSDKTLTRWCKRTYGLSFSDVFKEKRAFGKISLRRMQWELAKKNATMAIFLGKQFLGQKDTNNIEMTGANNGAIKTEIVVNNPYTDLTKDELLKLAKDDG